MIFIKETQLPVMNVVREIDKYIGVQGSNNIEQRVFALPINFKQLDLTDSKFVFSLQIRPVRSEEPPYLQSLRKEIVEGFVHLVWDVTRTHTKDPGELHTSLLLLNENEDIVWESYDLVFVVVDGIQALEQTGDIPQSILEQLVAQAGMYAQEAKDEADRINRLIVEASGHTIVDSNDNEMPRRAGLQFVGAGVTLEDDAPLDVTRVFITSDGGSGGDGGGALRYTHLQSEPSSQWNVQHNLGVKYVNAKIISAEGMEIFADVSYELSTINLLVIRMAEPLMGTVYITY